MNFNIDISTLTKDLRKKFNSSESVASYTPLTLEADWRHLVLFITFMIICILLAHGYIFMNVKSAETIGGNNIATSTQTVLFDKESLDYWSERMVVRQEYELDLNLAIIPVSSTTESPLSTISEDESKSIE